MSINIGLHLTYEPTTAKIERCEGLQNLPILDREPREELRQLEK